jgi:hypothetical protein
VGIEDKAVCVMGRCAPFPTITEEGEGNGRMSWRDQVVPVMWEEAPESTYHSEVDRGVMVALFKEASIAWVSKWMKWKQMMKPPC